jgi:hypothetical protein
MRDQPEDAVVPGLDDVTLEVLLARGGLSATDAQRAGLKTAYAHVLAMAERVRKPRGRMAEPALTYGFVEEDLR